MADSGDSAMQEVGKQSIQGVGRSRGGLEGGELATHTRILVLGQSNRPRPVP